MEAPNDKLKQPLVDPEMKAVSPRSLNSGAIFVLHNPSVDRDADEEKEEAHRRQGNRPQKHKFQYTAPNVHPYAVPQYDPQGYGGGPANVWGGDQKMENGEQGSMVDIVFSGMYTLAAALTIIQGFGMLIHFTFAAGVAAIMYDLNSAINGVSVESYLPFLGNYIGRATTILFFAVICAQTYEYSGWTKTIVLYNLLVAVLQSFVYFTTKTVTPSQAQVDDLSDL